MGHSNRRLGVPGFLHSLYAFEYAKKGLLGLALTSAVINPVIYYGTMPLPKYAYFIITMLVMQLFTLCFWLYKKFGSRLGGFVSTLMFLAFGCRWNSSLLFPKATWSVLAYTQAQNLSLAQMVSVTGIWGLSFLVTWFAAAAEWAWSHDFNWKIVKRGVIVFASSFAIIYLAGFSRVNFISTGQSTVKVASIVQSRSLNSSLASCKWTDARPLGIIAAPLKPISWQKPGRLRKVVRNLFCGRSLEDSFPDRRKRIYERGFQTLAGEEKVNLLLTLWSVPSDFPQHRVQNKLVLIDSNGVMQMNYLKSNPAPPEPILKGDGVIPVFKSDYGNIGAAICFDGDFPHSFDKRESRRLIFSFCRQTTGSKLQKCMPIWPSCVQSKMASPYSRSGAGDFHHE
jgi:hypothetical protein